MKYDIVLVPMVMDSGQFYCLAYKTMKGACSALGVSYNTATSYFRRNKSEISYTHNKTGYILIKANLL